LFELSVCECGTFPRGIVCYASIFHSVARCSFGRIQFS
jgi:hypothetical protein